MNDSKPLVIGYDGSDDAKRAIAGAGELLAGRPAVVVTAWQSIVSVISHYPSAGVSPIPTNVDELDRGIADGASRTADEGADEARTAGLEAEPLSVQADGAIWRAIVGVADDRGAGAIVVGPRGLGELKSLLLGSVSRGVLQNASIPVVIMPHAGSAA